MPVHPVVVVKQPEHRPLYLEVREALEVGRECDGVLLADPQVSRRHILLTPRRGAVVVEDLGSTNGTFINGARVHSEVVLAADSRVRLGDTVIELVTDSARAEGAAAGADGDASGVVRPAAVGGALRETSIEAVARAVDTKRPDLRAMGAYDGTVTIVFSDIESSTEHAMTIGDTGWIAVLNAHNAIVRKSLARWGGTEVKNQGDGFMVTFPSARRALCSMAEVQRELADFAAANPEQGVRIRVGMHTGEVIVDDGDIFGKHVIVAARVANLASGGEILVSSLVWDITSARGDLTYGEPRTVKLKGIEGDWTVYPLRWEDFEPTP